MTSVSAYDRWDRRLDSGVFGEDPTDSGTWVRDELFWEAKAEKTGQLFLSDGELQKLPALEWDVDGILPTGGLSYLVGQPGSGKSLLALWFACCISLGRPWNDRWTAHGPVIYVAAEGARSMHSRLEIWKSYFDHEKKDTGVHWFPRRLELRNQEQVAQFLTAAAKVSPRLVIIDTLARCTQGAKENDSDSIGEALAAVDRLREALNAGVLLLAHPSREGGDSPRGHSSQDGAADAIWVLPTTVAALERGRGARWLSNPIRCTA